MWKQFCIVAIVDGFMAYLIYVRHFDWLARYWLFLLPVADVADILTRFKASVPLFLICLIGSNLLFALFIRFVEHPLRRHNQLEEEGELGKRWFVADLLINLLPARTREQVALDNYLPEMQREHGVLKAKWLVLTRILSSIFYCWLDLFLRIVEMVKRFQ